MSPPRPRFTLLAAVSADGFIARHAADHPAAWASAEEQARFLAAVPRYDWAFMGRRTHELAFRPDRRRVIFSRSVAAPEWRAAAQLWVDPARHGLDPILAALAPVRRPGRCAILGGTEVHDWFLALHLVDRIELSLEPVVFGSGRPLLTGAAPGDPAAALAARGFREQGRRALNERGTLLLTLVPVG